MADSLEGLAIQLGINPQGLVNTIALYNRDVEKGMDTRFLKEPSALIPVKNEPFYGVQIVPAILALTSGGLRINPQTQVLTIDGAAIPGLYAAGETTGNVIGDRYPGGGSAIADAIVFGRIAGQEAADFVLGK